MAHAWDSPWSEPVIARLQKLWAEGRTASQIAPELSALRGLSITRNAVCGKAQRLGLMERGSPIKRAREDRQRAEAKPPKPKAPKPSKVPKPAKIERLPVVARQESRPVWTPPPRRGRVGACSWPLGEPGKPGFRFCGAASEPGRPYCGPHCADAYKKPGAVSDAGPAHQKAGKLSSMAFASVPDHGPQPPVRIMGRTAHD